MTRVSRPELLGLPADFDPCHFRHADVEDGDIRLQAVDELPCLTAVPGLCLELQSWFCIQEGR
jgi:hypothetical protein